MQKVSKTYKERIRDIFRDRGYIMISFGLINQEAQANATIDDGSFAYYSNHSEVLGNQNDEVVYATLEENFTRVDGSPYFLPREEANKDYYNTGLVGLNLVSAEQYELTISLNTVAIDFKGITINFGENYPVDFDMISSTGQTIQYRNNTEAKFTSEDVLTNTTSVKFIFYKMKNEHSRLRIYNIMFGYGLVYRNEDVMDSTLESYISPIGADVPQIDFSVSLQNYNQYFNVDNPNSAINFLETGQSMEIYYGYRISDDDEIEWLRGQTLLCSEWESDDYTATIKCQDVFRSMDSEYYKGVLESDGISYYNLAVKVLEDAGETNYYIDPRLKKLYTTNPLPRVKHKEALQIIANACRCVLTQSRTGQIVIKSNFKPDITSVKSSDESTYSNLQAILEKTTKQEYATFATNYDTVDGKMYFIPKSLKGKLYTGFVSKQQSDANGKFTTNPKITIVQEAQCMYYGLSLTFGSALPSGVIIHTYNNGSLVADYNVTDDYDIETRTVITHTFDDFDTMVLEFTGTQEPYNRITFNYFELGDITDFTIYRTDMLSSPKAIKQELVKEVVVPYYIYMNTEKEESLVSEDVTVSSGDEITYYIGEASYGYYAKLTTIEEDAEGTEVEGATVVASGAYYVKVRYTIAGTYRLEVIGHRYDIVESNIIQTLNARGKIVTWENPLMSNAEMATLLAEWIGDYYKSGIEYEYDYRGYPELDVNDIVYQENDFHKNMKVNVYDATLTFNGAFGGKITARRQGG